MEDQECEGVEKSKKELPSRREGKDVVENEFERDPLNGDLHKNRLCLSEPPL